MSEEFDLHLVAPKGERPLWVLATENEVAEYRALSPHNCKHTTSQVRDYRTKNGGWQRKPQCTTCGYSTGNPIKRNPDEKVPPWDPELQENWEGQCEEKRYAIESRLIERTANTEVTGYAFYEEYLQSEEWKTKRDLVLARDDGLCQACLSSKATEVHHMTYDQIFDEYLFDLVSVCRNCHERLHSKQKAAVGAARAKSARE